jgi:hypothetical protein
MKVEKLGGMAVAGALIVVLASVTQFVCSTWLSMSAPLVQTMVLTALSMCGSGFAALMEVSAPRCNASFAREGPPRDIAVSGPTRSQEYS